MTIVDREGDKVLVEWTNGTQEWISVEDYQAYSSGMKAMPVFPDIKSVPDTKVVKGRVAKKATSPVRPIEDDGAPRA